MEIKSCIFCKHFSFDAGHVYSEWTVDEPSMECFKGYFYESPSHSEINKGIARASNCKDYEVSESILEEIS